MRKWLWAVIRNGCHLAVREDSRYFCNLLKSLRFGSDWRFVLIKILVPSLQTFGAGSADRDRSCTVFVLCTVVRWSALWYWFGFELVGVATIRAEQ